jgi:sugar O-acyltransferase (sialic acid O-acetyltransferase NeuD family)
VTDSAKDRKLVIVGDSAFAEVACAYFTHDSRYEVAGFAVERAYLKRDVLLGLPVVALEDIGQRFPAESHCAYVAIVYSQMNRLRTRLVQAMRNLGYPLASFVSSAATVWPDVVVGEHSFIFENNVIQPFVTLGSNIVLWSGNHVGHHATIRDNAFISSHVVISGFADIGENCFLGVNVAVANNVTIARDCWIGPGVVISRDTKEGELYRPPVPELAKVDSLRFFRVK